MSQETRIEQMTRLLKNQFKPTALEIIDESDLHRGHPGAQGGGGHYKLAIASASFEGLNSIQAHKKIYQCLDTMMGPEIHALSIKILPS